MTPQKTNRTFNPALYWLLVVPPIVFLALYRAGGGVAPLQLVLTQLIAWVCLAYVYSVQMNVLRGILPGSKLKWHGVVLVVAFIAPCIATLAGDYHGASVFQDALGGVSWDLWAGFVAGSYLSLILYYCIVLGNILAIRTGSSRVWLKNLGRVFYILGYLLIAVCSWVAYSLVYSLHDPNTE